MQKQGTEAYLMPLSQESGKTPLLTVVIPTYKRPRQLGRAINSALLAAPEGDVEVVVVPNGSDTSWHSVAIEFSAEDRVTWHASLPANVSAARNHGLRLARGEFVRFLDDDDYLYPDTASSQCLTLIESGADICSGGMNAVLEDGKHIRSWNQPETTDFCEAMLGSHRRAFTPLHVYRRSILSSAAWNESRSLNEDMEWILSLCAGSEISWVRSNESVAAWVQHPGPRLSKGRDPGDRALKDSAQILLLCFNELSSSSRLTIGRRKSAADGLMSLFQKGFKYDPKYWVRVARKAEEIFDGQRPPSLIYRSKTVRKIDPAVVESLLLPARWLYHPLRRALESFGIARL